MDGSLYIERIDIGAFGGLSQKSVSFKEGINLINAPNESGKSTLAAALRFALYGFKGGNSKTLDKNPKKMYTPWSGASAKVAVTLGGSRRLRIERTVNGTKEQASCTDLATGQALYTGQCFGEQIFGIGVETFEKTLFFSTLNPPESKDTELASALQNLVFSADEQTGTEKAVKVLNDHKNALDSGRLSNGELLRLKSEIQRLEEKLEKEKTALKTLNELEASAAQTSALIALREERVKQLEEEKRNCENYRAAILLNDYAELKQKEKKARQDLEAAGYADTELEQIEKCRAARDNMLNAERRLEEAKGRYATAQNALPATEADGAALTAAYKSYRGRKRAATLLLVLAVVAAIVGACGCVLLTAEALAGYLALAAAVLLAVFGAACGISARSALKKRGFPSGAALAAAVADVPARRAESERLHAQAENAEREMRLAADECESARRAFALLVPSADINEVDRMYAGYAAAGEKRALWQTANGAVTGFEAANDLEELAKKAENAVKPSRTSEQIESEYSFVTQAVTGLKQKLAEQNGKIKALKEAGDDPCDTESKLLWTRDRYAEKLREYNALVLAKDEINAASDEMRASISPRIAAIAGNCFAVATGGKYSGIELDTKLSMSFESEIGMKNAEHLSAGTRETVYLCLRLAIIKLIYGAATVPVVLDDAFAHTDDERLAALLRLLVESGNQVIIASCTERERAALAAVGAEYNGVDI